MAKISSKIKKKFKKKVKNKFRSRIYRILKNLSLSGVLLAAVILIAQFYLPRHGFFLDKDEYQVVKVVDGDTVHVVGDNGERTKIRLAYIDAPEYKQAYGKESREYLNYLIYQKKVKLERVDQDRYGRTVARIWFQEEDINLLMIHKGLAWHYKAYQKKQLDYAVYAKTEWSAKQNRVGIWRDKNAVPPWLYRDQKQKKSVVK